MRIVRITACVVAGIVLFAQSGPAQHAPHVATRPAPKPKNAKGMPGGMQAPKRASSEQIEKLEKMSPADRQKALEALPPNRREKIENRLDRLQKLSPDQRAKLEGRLKKFESLPPEQQKQVRKLAKQFQSLPAERRPIVRHELNSLRGLPEAEREARVTSADFRAKYSPEEQEILKQSSTLLPEQF